MKHFLLSLVFAVSSFALVMPEAEAKRLGGGSSFGMKRQATPAPAPRQPATAQTPNRPADAAAKPRSSWMGPVAGLAAGLGLAALASHLGLGEEFGSILMMILLAAGAFFLFRMLFRRSASANRMSYAGAGANAGQDAPAAAPAAVPSSNFQALQPVSASAATAAIPADFDAEGFAREAKVQFIRLQAAHDEGNLDDIRAFTTPEVFAEIRMQMSEAGSGTQRTDVVELHAEVVEVAEEAAQYVVSVRFNGLLREAADQAPQAFDEIWHLTKPADGSRGWVIAGIQQVS